MRGIGARALCLATVTILALVAGCKSAHVQVSVVNQTGGPIRLLEVDYPSASFGTDSLASNATYRYRIQVLGDGPVKVQYTAASGEQPQNSGPALAEGQQGALEIVLLPGGKARFDPRLATGR